MYLRSLIVGAMACIFALQTQTPACSEHTFVGPTGRIVAAAPTCGYGAYSVLGEVAPRNFRLNGTFAYQVCDNHYFKISTDWLTQKLRYRPVKHRHIWVHEESYGAAYAYTWDCGILSTLDANVYYSRAHNKDFSDLISQSIDPVTDAVVTSTLRRHVAGASFWGLSAGFTIEPIECTSVSLALNYDDVDYRTKFRSLDSKTGLGGTLAIHYQWSDCVGIDFSGCWRKPYDDYQAAINWFFEGCGQCDRFALGIFGGYTHAKYGVPNVGNAGLQLAYWVGDNKGCCNNSCNYDPCCEPCREFDIVAWASRPAVYDPVVVATRDTFTITTIPVLPPAPAP